MTKHFKHIDRAAITGPRLAGILRLGEGNLVPLAQRTRLPFSFSASFGLWIHKNDLPRWREAADAYRAER